VRTFCTVQGGPPGRSRRRHGALAYAPAGALAPAAPTPVVWREKRERGPLNIQQVSSAPTGTSLLPLPGLSGTDQNLSRPSVTAGQPHSSSCAVDVRAKTALTNLPGPGGGSYRKQGHTWPKLLTLNTATALISTSGLTCGNAAPRRRAVAALAPSTCKFRAHPRASAVAGLTVNRMVRRSAINVMRCTGPLAAVNLHLLLRVYPP